MTLHLFAGSFESLADARLYTEEQWEPELPDTASEEEYEAWEDNNPTWALRDELDADYLTPDFIETIDGEDRVAYVERLLVSDDDRAVVREAIGDGDSILVVIFDAAFDGKRARPASTSRLRYVGAFKCDMFQ